MCGSMNPSLDSGSDGGIPVVDAAFVATSPLQQHASVASAVNSHEQAQSQALAMAQTRTQGLAAAQVHKLKHS